MVDSRKNTLVNVLYQQQGYVSAEALSLALDVSLRTIYRYVKQFNEAYQKCGLQIESKKGVGYRLLVSDEQIPLIQALLAEERTNEAQHDQLNELIGLLATSRGMGLTELSQRLYLSQASLIRLIKRANQQLAAHQLKICHQQNQYHLIGTNERALRNYLLKLILEEPTFKAFFKVPYEISTLKQSVQQCLKSAGIYDCFDVQVLTWAVVISLAVPSLEHELSQVDSPTYQPLIELYHLSTSDIMYIQDIAQKLLQTNSQAYHDKILHSIDQSLSGFIDRFTNVHQDKISLIENLLAHFKQILKRSILNVELSNPYLHSIKNKYPLEFNLAGLVCYQIGQEIAVTFSEDEIAYVALYLVTIIQQYRQAVEHYKVVIVCEHGLSTGYLLAEEVKTYFPEFDICSVVSTSQLQSQALEAVDFIISTVPLAQVNRKPVIVVSHLFNQSAVELVAKIKHELLDKRYQYQDLIIQTPYLLKGQEVSSVLKEMLPADMAIDQQNDLLAALLNREEIAPTALGQQIAFPHVVSDKLAASSIRIGIAREGIEWGVETVKLVFLAMFRQNDADLVGIFRNLYHFCKNDTLIEKTIREETSEYLITFMKGE